MIIEIRTPQQIRDSCTNALITATAITAELSCLYTIHQWKTRSSHQRNTTAPMSPGNQAVNKCDCGSRVLVYLLKIDAKIVHEVVCLMSMSMHKRTWDGRKSPKICQDLNSKLSECCEIFPKFGRKRPNTKAFIQKSSLICPGDLSPAGFRPNRDPQHILD